VDRPPARLPNTSSRLIAMAASLVGAAEDVATEMRCSAEDFREYRAGTKEPSAPELERLVALIIREQAKVIAKNRELLVQMRARKTPPG
jgi:hypothetical protein